MPKTPTKKAVTKRTSAATEEPAVSIPKEVVSPKKASFSLGLLILAAFVIFFLGFIVHPLVGWLLGVGALVAVGYFFFTQK